ncbi:hypothetical protein RBB80_11020 [Tunturiibacter gelidiferens]
MRQVQKVTQGALEPMRSTGVRDKPSVATPSTTKRLLGIEFLCHQIEDFSERACRANVIRCDPGEIGALGTDLPSTRAYEM